MVVKKLNLKNYVEANCEGKTVYSKPMVVLEGKHGVVVTDNEFIHVKNDLITDSIRIYVHDQMEEGYIAIMPDGYFPVQLSELLEDPAVEIEEVEPQYFFRYKNYNARIGRNYSDLMKALHEIGYDKIDELDADLEKGGVY